MKMVRIFAITFIAMLVGCTGDMSSGGSANDEKVTFAKAQTLINEHCVSCHQAGSANGVFESYGALMDTGFIVPGNANASALCTVAQADPAPLPANLPPEVAQDLCAWIAAGALDD
jgi:uncharacterized membrane protein